MRLILRFPILNIICLALWGHGSLLAQAIQPNIVLINLDDADYRMLSDERLVNYYPSIWNLAQNGVRFTNAHATSPFCAPSRAALMRGQYGFQTRVCNNSSSNTRSNGFPGGYEAFLAQDHHNNELGLWMKEAGYHTIHVGKYHHSGFDEAIPQGWTDFAQTGGARYFNNSRFSNIVIPTGQRRRAGKDVYTTHLDLSDSVYFLNNHFEANPDQPFFLYIAPLAPHLPTGGDPLGMVEPQYENWESPPFPMDPSFGEADMSDKPAHIQQLRELEKQDLSFFETYHQSRARSVKSVDDLVAGLRNALDRFEPSVAVNTWIFLTSDNGFQLGQHRMLAKQLPYEESTRVPLMVVGPDTQGAIANHLIAHIDICPTILELAGVPIPDLVEGKSFAPLLNDPLSVSEPDWQPAIMIENWSVKRNLGVSVNAAYAALRMYDSIYIGWSNAESEYYDLSADPFQLENAYPLLPPETQTALREQLAGFRTVDSPPFTTITTRDNMEFLGANIELAGFCEDNRSSQQVNLTIRSEDSGLYWNGSEWQLMETQISLEPDADYQPLSTWSLNVEFPRANKSGLDILHVTAFSEDTTGNIGADSATTELMVDTRKPDVSYSKQLFDGVQLPRGSVALHGNQSDNLEVESVEMLLQDIGTSEYWNGKTFQVEPVWIDTSLVLDVWTISLPLPTGLYESRVRATDISGNQTNELPLLFEVIGMRR